MEAEAAQLDDLRDAAYGLGMAFAQAAMAEGDLDRKLALFDAFHRSSASVRLSIALQMRLRREAKAPPRPEIERPDAERLEIERPERAERPDDYDERDRDRERVSFPLLLRTLSRVADDAQALLPEAAELPSLREILDRVKAAPSRATPSAVAGNLRARLTGAATTQVLIRPPAPPGPPPPRSTGPP